MADPGENTFNVEGVIQSSFVSLNILETAETRMISAQDDRDSLDAEFKSLSADQNDKLREITELNKEINSLNRILTSSRQSLGNLEKEKVKNEARRKDIDDILDKLEKGDESIPGLEKERKDLEARHVVLIDSITGLKDDILEKEQLITDKEKERVEATKISNTLANQIRGVSSRLAIAETTLLEATQLYNGYKTTFDFQQSQIVSIASVVDDPVSNLVNSIVNKGVSLDTQIKAKNNKISELTGKREELKDKKNECEVSQLNFDIASSLPETYSVWEIRFNNDFQAWMKLIELKIRGYKIQHGGIAPDNEAKEHIRNIYEAIGDELTSLYKEYAEQKERYELMISQLNSLPGAIKTTEKNIARFEGLIEKYESALTAIEDEISSLEEKRPDLEDSKSFNEEIINDTTEFIDSTNKGLEEVKTDLRSVEAALVNNKADKTKEENKITTLTTQITGLETAIATLESEIAALEKSNKDLNSEIETLNEDIKTLVIKRDEGGGLNDDETTELATKQASLSTKKAQVGSNEKSLDTKKQDKIDREEDVDVSEKEKEAAEKSLIVIGDKIKDREKSIAETKGKIAKMENDIAKETSKRTTAIRALKSIDKELSELKANLLVLEEDKAKNENLLDKASDDFGNEREKLEDQRDELKQLTDNDNEVIKEAKKDMETGLGQYTIKKEEKAEQQLKKWKSELEGNIEDKLELIEKTDTLLVEANNMAKALMQFEDAKAFNDQVGTAISNMVNGNNDEENAAIDKQRQASDDLEINGEKVNISAREANIITGGEKFAMTVTGPLIKGQIANDPTKKFVYVPIELDVAPEEIDTCLRLGYGISFKEVSLRKGDTFTKKLQMKISWEVNHNEGRS